MFIFLSLLIGHFFLLSKLIFTAWPEMLSYPYLLVNGFTLYKDLIAPYTPGLIIVEALFFKLFGFTPEMLKVLAWIFIGLGDLLMFLILRNITRDKILAGIFLGIFILWQSFFDGNMLWFDSASLLPLLAALLFIQQWLKSGSRKDFFLIGLFLALAFMVKQIALIYFPAFLLIYFFNKKKIIKVELIVFALGGLIVGLPFLLHLALRGTLVDFWLWCFYYPAAFWSQFPGYIDINIVGSRLKVSSLLFLPLVGVFASYKRLFTNKHFIFAFTFFITSLIAVYPRFSYFHLQPPIAFLIILFSLIYMSIPEKMKKFYLILLITVTLLLVTGIYKLQKGQDIRFYGEEEKKLASEINKRVNKNDRVWLLGPTSMEYVLAKHLPSKPWIDNFGWYLEIPGVQEQVIAGLEKDQVKFIFWQQPQAENWYDLGTYQPKKIVEFIKSSYQKIDRVDNIEIWERN